ncbi:MAG: hypothetical protein IAF02_14250 [Anaerolineae bacterium]|nr:hypothetical protein [Anaerolineae bacterium]
MVWDRLGDSRVRALWQKARVLLQQRSEKVTDAAARKLFLEQVLDHRAFVPIQV